MRVSLGHFKIEKKFHLSHGCVAASVILSDDSGSNDVERRRDSVANRSGNPTAYEVTHVRVIAEKFDVSSVPVELVVSRKLSEPVEHAQKLRWNVTFP